MDKTWVKLYRKARDNDIMRDPIAWTLFSYILLTVNRETGSMKTGRIYLSRMLNVHQSAIYRALKRLEKKYELCATKRTTKYTEISVLKWHVYQGKDSEVNKSRTTTEQQPNTIQEERSKNNTYTSYIQLTQKQLKNLKDEFTYLDIDYEYQRFREWQKGTGAKFPNVLARFKAWLLQQRHEDKKETNVILEDPIFKQLKGVWEYNEGTGFIRKADLQSRLGRKYPAKKFAKEWEEAKAILK